MQAQQTRSITQSISQTQSLAAVQTLLRAGLGAITFLRNLLPEDNFTQSHFTTIDDSPSSEVGLSQPTGSQESIASRRNVNGFRIMTITRGYTDEADKILNYLEYGIFDALEKRYLRSFIFAIYLDKKDPTNIVEAYTFNFKYHVVPGSGISVPVMTFSEGQTMNSKSTACSDDAVSRAIKSGKAPTLKDVKMSVKTMLKTLIQTMNHMDVLPRRRFATFKVFYTDETPANYEPPNFQPGDVDKDRWYFMTHDLDEVPERCSIGKVQTGHHSVKLSVTSIASYLPSSTEYDDAIFSGTTTHPGRLGFTPLREAAICKNQVEKQLEDAENRNLLWPADDSAELGDEDADGEDDPDYVKGPDGQYILIDSISPIGFRTPSGDIEPIPIEKDTENMTINDTLDDMPRNLREIVAKELPKASAVEETQPLLSMPKIKVTELSLASSGDGSTISPITTSSRTPDFDPEMLKNMTIDMHADNDIEMLELETQIEPLNESANATEPIESFSRTVSQLTRRGSKISDNGLQCYCNISVDGMCCFCEGGCRKWFHVWCMGYHTTSDPIFVCFDCRIRADDTWELLKYDIYPLMTSKYQELALFRRAIKIAEREKNFTSHQFSQAFGGDVILSGQMLRRLEEEEFVLVESTTLDDMGLTVTSHTKKNKNKGKGTTKPPKQRKNMQKKRYIFNQEMLSKAQYLDYFKPGDQDIENRMLGLSEMTDIRQTMRRAQVMNSFEETQLQEETQRETTQQKRVLPENEMKGADRRVMKRVKISLAVGVDLAE